MAIQTSIIIVSYNTREVLTDCLNSFYDDLDESYEVIVVDNASTDGSVEMVQKGFPSIKLISNNQNLGYAKANNQGIKAATGAQVILLNSDTLTSASTFESLVKFALLNPKVAIVSPKLLNADKSIQHNGGALPNLINVLMWQFFLDEIPLLTHLVSPYHQDDPEFYNYTQRTGWVSGACMLLTRQCLEKVGLLDEQIFMYAEDVDYCKRASQAGLQVWTYGQASLIHLGQGSGDKSKALIGEYRGMSYFLTKHHSWLCSIMQGILISGAYTRALVYTLIGSKHVAQAYLQAAQVVRST